MALHTLGNQVKKHVGDDGKLQQSREFSGSTLSFMLCLLCYSLIIKNRWGGQGVKQEGK